MSDGGGSRQAGDTEAGSDVDFVVVHDPADVGWAKWIAWQVGQMKLPGADRHAKVLLGAWNNVPGSNWTADVNEALQDGARVLPVVSERSAQFSETSADDAVWQAAMAVDSRGSRRLVVPVVIDGGSLSGLLAGRSPIQLTGLDEARAVAELTAGIEAAVRGPVRPSVPPPFPGNQKPAFPGSPTSGSGRPGSATVSVLHLTGLRFGSAQARSGQLLDELIAFGVTGDLRPDLVVVAGDLTEAGGKREFDEAYRFLTELTEMVGLTCDRVAIVPGSHDVNRRLCKAYFVECEEDDEPPQPPYWPKWKYFDALMRRFYGDEANVLFQVGQEWSLFEITDCKVVVAGLNSTMAETHDVRRGELGDRQLAAVEERLRRYEKDGWLRIGAVRHDPTAKSDAALYDAAELDRVLGPRLNLLLHGQRHDDGAARLPSGLPVWAAAAGRRFELLRFDGDGWRCHASTGDVADIRHRFTAVGATFPAPTPAPAPASAPPSGRNFDDRHESRPRDPLDDLAEIARLRFPGAAVTRVEAVGDMPAHLRVQGTEGPVVETRVIGFVEGEADVAAVEEFDRVLRRPYLAKFPNLYPLLVYGGERQAEPDVARLSVQRDVELRSLAEYQGVLDLRGYRARQHQALLADPDYPPELYVPQRIRRMDRSSRAVHDDALAQVTDWLTTDDVRFVLVLGSFGHGKTFLMHKLALELREHLPNVTPMLIKLRDLEKSLDLDRLVAQHLVDRGERRNDLNAFDYMRRQGRLVLLFDGFDELVVRVTYERAVAYLDTLLGAVGGRAKVVVTSRREFFLTDDEVLKRTGEKVEQTSGRFIVQVEDFTPEQVKQFLYGYYVTRLEPELPDVEGRRAEAGRRADDRLGLMRNLANLLDLASNPRLLSFIAELDDDRLVAARRHTTTTTPRAANGDGGAPSAAVTPADLYHELVEQWLDHETRRSPDLTSAERHAAISELAVTMWRAGESYVDLAGLTAVAQRVLSSMHDPRGRSAAETAHELGSGTALRRDAEGRFSFIHQSLMEYLVANKAATALDGPGGGLDGRAGILDSRRMSELMADFFADRCGEQRAAAWAQAVIDDAEASPEAKANALLVANRRGFALRAGAKLAGADFAGQDLSSRRDLRGADLEGANLTDARLVGADLTGANLRQATMTGMTIQRTNLSNADLTDANLTGARLTEVNLTGALLTRSRWARTAVLGGQLAIAEDADALAAASVAKRDLAETVVLSASSPTYAVAFSPDGTLLATGSADDTTRLWDTTTGQHLRTLEGHTGPVRSVAFSPDGTLLATGSNDDTTRLWDTTTGQHLRTLEGHATSVQSVAFSPDGTLLATGSNDRTTRLWDTTTGQHLRTLEGHTDWVQSVAFSPDGTLLATGSADRTTRLWDTTTGQHLRTLEGHTDWVRSVAFSPDGTLLATGSNDSTTRLWDTTTGGEIDAMIGTADGWAVLLPDGRYKLSGDPNGAFWWVIKTVRFEPGVLDDYDPSVRRLPEDARLPLPAGWHPVAPRVAPPGPRPKPAKRGLFRRG